MKTVLLIKPESYLKKRGKIKMTNIVALGAPYDYVQTKEVISDVLRLLHLDQTPSGTGPTSIVIARGKIGGRNILGLEGLGKELWGGIDAQEYINNIREEWDE